MMKTLLIGLALVAGSAQADLWDLYDGDGTTPKGKFPSQQGLSCDSYNEMAGFSWKHKGGDWIDADGVEQGINPQTAIVINASKAAQRVTIDYTPLIGSAGVVMRRSPASVIKIATRESGTPPVLRMWMADGSVVERLAIADASMQFVSPGKCSVTANQKGEVASINHALIMGFGDWPHGVVKAELSLTVLSASLRTTLQLFALQVPRTEAFIPAPPVAADPEYLWRVTFDEFPKPCDKWWVPGLSGKPSAQWKQDGGLWIVPGSSGVWCASGDPEPVPAQGTNGTVKVQRGTGAVGNGVMFVYHPTILAAGTAMINPNLRKLNGDRDLDEAWLSYWVKFGEDFHSFNKCEGGKLPGFKGLSVHCGNSSQDANGLCGWSLRMSYKMQCDPANPSWGHVLVYTYAYHGLMSGYYGQTWTGNERTLLKHGQWHCIEQYVKVNTPGIADGLNRVYIDGDLAINREAVYLRGERPAQGYGKWWNSAKYDIKPGAVTLEDNFGRLLWSTGPYTAATELGISGVWWVQHGGGVTPPGKTAQLWQDELSVSRHRAGCPARGTE